MGGTVEGHFLKRVELSKIIEKKTTFSTKFYISLISAKLGRSINKMH